MINTNKPFVRMCKSFMEGALLDHVHLQSTNRWYLSAGQKDNQTGWRYYATWTHCCCHTMAQANRLAPSGVWHVSCDLLSVSRHCTFVCFTSISPVFRSLHLLLTSHNTSVLAVFSWLWVNTTGGLHFRWRYPDTLEHGKLFMSNFMTGMILVGLYWGQRMF